VSARQAAKPIFALRLQHRFGRHFEKADFSVSNHSSSGFHILVTALPLLRGLRALHFSLSAYDTLFNGKGATDVEVDIRWEIFRDLAPSITELDLEWMPPPDTSRLLSLFSAVQSLHLSDPFDDELGTE